MHLTLAFWFQQIEDTNYLQINQIHHSVFENQKDYLGVNIFWSLFSKDPIKDCLLKDKERKREQELSEGLHDAVAQKIILEEQFYKSELGQIRVWEPNIQWCVHPAVPGWEAKQAMGWENKNKSFL